MNLIRNRSILDASNGRSEFAIVLFVDIRGFSSFSTGHDSIETAIFIRRFFQIVIDNYFSFAKYAKPTGDGLLLVINYSENDLRDVAEQVLRSSVRLHAEFHKLFVDEGMVNFAVPEKIGIGISRGTICCLYSKKEIIDYSGRVLNLAARLMELARPSGIVVDGQFQFRLLTPEIQDLFDLESVYIRGIYEQEPIGVHFLKGSTQILDSAKTPLVQDILVEQRDKIQISRLRKIPNRYIVTLEKPVKNQKSIVAELILPHPEVEGLSLYRKVKEFTYEKQAKFHKIYFDVAEILSFVKEREVSDEATAVLRIEYATT